MSSWTMGVLRDRYILETLEDHISVEVKRWTWIKQMVGETDSMSDNTHMVSKRKVSQ